MWRSFVGLVLAFTSWGYAAAQATSSVYLHAEPGSYVGGTLANGEATFVGGVDGNFRSANFGNRSAYVYTTSPNGWTFSFSAPQFSPLDGLTEPRALEVGLYESARRQSFNGTTNPGMDVYGNNRGYNSLSGWFEVLAVSYSASFELLSLAVDFMEYGENLTQSGPALSGSLRFNSDVPLTIPSAVPEPSSFALLVAGLAMLLLCVKRKGGSKAS